MHASIRQPSPKCGKRRGVVLIVVAGVLAVLAALGAGFYSLMAMQTKSAVRYSDSVRAEFMAHAGLQYAIGQLRQQAFLKTEDTADPWYTVDYLNGATRKVSFPADLGGGNFASYSASMANTAGPDSDRFTLKVSDASSKININAGDNLAVILDNLCRLIGPPLTCADLNLLQPHRWGSAPIGEGGPASYDTNPDDTAGNTDVYYKLGPDGRPVTLADGTAKYGDGYAIAGYRARNGRFQTFTDLKKALTYVERSVPPDGKPNDPLEIMEVEAKFAVLKEYITLNSWIDTNTVCVGKFEWASYDTLIDRDKSWIASVDSAGTPIVDPKNERGTLRGSYVSIINGHGAGQLRRIAENGTDWLKIEGSWATPNGGAPLYPGPISSYMIIAKEDALTEDVTTATGVIKLPKQNSDGTLVDDPDIDYSLRPLCIHRAPVNINTASDKVLAALFMGLDIQHGHPMALGTDATLPPVKTAWFMNDVNKYEPYLLTWNGLKRIPVDTGKIVFDRPMPTADPKFAYLNNYGTLDPAGSANVNEAHELAYRIITARQKTDPSLPSEIDPLTGLEKGSFHSWDDLYFRVVKPWDDARSLNKASVARMIMAHFNSNTDLLKFNPNIEWIDRWGRNFTEMEPVMVYDTTTKTPLWIPGDGQNMWSYSDVNWGGRPKGAYYVRSMRYKSTDMIDKSDLNRSTTEFCFDSNGIYEIQSMGQAVKSGQVLSERRMDSLVKVYDVWRETTQRQFVQGRFYAPAGMGAPGTSYSGQVTRDAYNDKERLPLNTLPEPLTPLKYRLNSAKIQEVVDSGAANGRDVFGAAKSAGVPDVIANRILPAQYDGQIVLATNTSAGPMTGGAKSETFVAHFDGDLDTDDCKGNGRELAKVPNNKTIRVVDTTGLLGVLNDNQIDFDPKENDPGAAKVIPAATYDVFSTKGNANVFKRLSEANYWENVTCRMGDLRTDGVYLGNIGISGKDATLKYSFANNYNPGNTKGATISMWFKPTWNAMDYREHEFFNATNPGGGFGARYNILTKYGRYSWCLPTGTDGDGSGGPHVSCNDLAMVTEDLRDADYKTYLHGGTRKVPGTQVNRESPSFHIQPFRWGFVGGKFKYQQTGLINSPEYSGYWEDESGLGLTARDKDITDVERPFIDSARQPEGPAASDPWTTKYFWKQFNATDILTSDIGKQKAGWSWFDGANATPVFGVNNLNEAAQSWLYRSQPIDGTLAVIDEMKLTEKWWTNEEVYQDMTQSRYYLPPTKTDAANRAALCPTFTSQTMLQSLKGYDKTTSDETVAVVRVSWNVFTPRFMHENREQLGARTEIAHGAASAQKYRGPFDYVQYNRELMLTPPAPMTGTEGTVNAAKPFFGVARPSPKDYPLNPVGARQSHASMGVEVELVDSDPYSSPTAPAIAGKPPFTNPDALNSYGDFSTAPRVKTSALRYRIRFLYPTDALVAGAGTVTPSTQYLLDTPIFDDISISYVGKLRFLDFRQVNE